MFSYRIKIICLGSTCFNTYRGNTWHFTWQRRAIHYFTSAIMSSSVLLICIDISILSIFFLLSVKSSGRHRRRLINITVFFMEFPLPLAQPTWEIDEFFISTKRQKPTQQQQTILVEKCFGFKVIDIIHDKKFFGHFRAVIITVDAIEQSKLACAQNSRCAKQGDWTKDFVYEKWRAKQHKSIMFFD